MFVTKMEKKPENKVKRTLTKTKLTAIPAKT
jgi:hypothetical protein